MLFKIYHCLVIKFHGCQIMDKSANPLFNITLTIFMKSSFKNNQA